jgi:hypothetical protein
MMRVGLCQTQKFVKNRMKPGVWCMQPKKTKEQKRKDLYAGSISRNEKEIKKIPHQVCV